MNIAKNMGLAKIAVAEQKLSFNLCLCFKSFFSKHDFPKIVIKIHDKFCRNPTLAKCGGEAQHLEKLEVWSPPGLPNVQSSTTWPKTPRIEAFLVSLERS